MIEVQKLQEDYIAKDAWGLVSSIDLHPPSNPYWLANLPTHPVELPLIHPLVARDEGADHFHERRVYEIRQPHEIVARKVRTKMGDVLRALSILPRRNEQKSQI